MPGQQVEREAKNRSSPRSAIAQEVARVFELVRGYVRGSEQKKHHAREILFPNFALLGPRAGKRQAIDRNAAAKKTGNAERANPPYSVLIGVVTDVLEAWVGLLEVNPLRFDERGTFGNLAHVLRRENRLGFKAPIFGFESFQRIGKHSISEGTRKAGGNSWTFSWFLRQSYVFGR